jgi:hypothetical protein
MHEGIFSTKIIIKAIENGMRREFGETNGFNGITVKTDSNDGNTIERGPNCIMRFVELCVN